MYFFLFQFSWEFFKFITGYHDRPSFCGPRPLEEEHSRQAKEKSLDRNNVKTFYKLVFSQIYVSVALSWFWQIDSAPKYKKNYTGAELDYTRTPLCHRALVLSNFDPRLTVHSIASFEETNWNFQLVCFNFTSYRSRAQADHQAWINFMILRNMFCSNISAHCFLAINLGDCTPVSTLYQDYKRTAKHFLFR